MFKWLLKITLSFVTLFLIILACLPMILSSNWGKEQLISYLSVSMKSSVKIQSVKLGWFGQLKAKDLLISSPDLQIQIESIESEKGLFSFLLSGFAFDEVRITAPKCTIMHLSSKKEAQKGSSIGLIKHLILKEGQCIVVNQEKKIQFDQIDLDLHLNRSKKQLDVALATRTSYDEKLGNIELKATYQHAPTFPIFSAKADCTDLPLKGLDQVFQLIGLYPQPLLSSSFGESADIHLNLDSTSNLLEASVNTRYLSLNLDTKKEEAPLIFDWSVNPELLKLFSLPISSPFSVSATINHLSFPSLQEFQNAELKMRMVLTNLKYDLFDFERVQLDVSSQNLKEQFEIASQLRFLSPHIKGECHANSRVEQFSHVDLTLNSDTLYFVEPLTQVERRVNHLQLVAKKGHVQGDFTLDDLDQPTLLGNQFKGKLHSNYTLDALDGFTLSLNSNLLKSELSGTFDFYERRLRLSKDGFIDYRLHPLVFQKASSAFPFPLQLKNTTHVSFILEKSSSIDTVRAKLLSEDFTVAIENPPQEYEFQNIDSQIEYVRSKDLLSAKAALNIKKEGQVQIELIDRLKENDYTLKLDATQLPSNLFNPWLHLNAPLATIIGPTVDLKATLNSQLDFNLKSENLTLSGGVRRDEVTSQISGKLTITPEAYEALNKEKGDHFSLSEPAFATLKINKFKIDPKVGFDSSEMKGAFELRNFKAKKGQLEALVDSFELHIKKKKNEKASATLSSAITSKKQQAKVDGSLTITSLDTSLPLYPMLASMRIDSSLSINKLPTFVIEAMIQPFGEFPVEVILGEQLNAQLKVDMGKESKRVKVDIDSTQADLQVEGIVAKRRFLLTQPVKGAFKLSDKLSHFMFDNLGFAITKARVPITLDISDREFVFPLHKHPLQETQIDLMILDPGQLTAINSGTIRGVNSIFKLQAPNTLPMWFAPFYMHMKNGILYIERTEVLLDGRYHICMWGVIDYNQKRVDMTIGLTEQSLKQTLGIDGLPSSYVLQVPLSGPFGDVKLQTGAVAAKLALLIGGNATTPNTLFGGIVNVVNQVMNDQSKVPKPKRPYPWENQASYQTKPVALKFSAAKDKELVALPPTDLFHKEEEE